MGAALLVSFGAPVACHSYDAVLTRTLSCELVAGFPRGSYRMAVARFAGFAVCNLFGRISVISFTAIVTVSACRKMTAFKANTSRHTARQFVQLHVKFTSTGMLVALAGFTLVGISGGSSSPGAIKVEGLAPFAVPAGRIMFAFAGQLTIASGNASASMSIALASPTDGEVRHGILVGDLMVSSN